MLVQSSHPVHRLSSNPMCRTVWITCPLRLLSSLPSSGHPLLSMPLEIHDFIGGAIEYYTLLFSLEGDTLEKLKNKTQREVQ